MSEYDHRLPFGAQAISATPSMLLTMEERTLYNINAGLEMLLAAHAEALKCQSEMQAKMDGLANQIASLERTIKAAKPKTAPAQKG